MKTKYECNVCNGLYDTPGDAEACEAQGKPTDFPEGTCVFFNRHTKGWQDPPSQHKGVVVSTTFSRSKHEPCHTIEVDDTVSAELKLGTTRRISPFAEKDLTLDDGSDLIPTGATDQGGDALSAPNGA